MNRRNLGILCLIGPVIILFTSLTFYGIASFILASLSAPDVESASATLTLIAQFLRVVISLIFILALIGIPLGIPTGIYLLTTKKEQTKNRSK